MKRYLAFAYDGYYPAGSRQDFEGEYDSVEEFAAKRPWNEMADVLDTSTGEWVSLKSKAGPMTGARGQSINEWVRDE